MPVPRRKHGGPHVLTPPRGRRSSAASPPAACGVWLSLDVMVRSSGRDVRRRFCSGLFRRGPFRPPSGLQKASSPLEPFLRSTRRSALRSTRSRHASQIPPHSLNANRCNLTNTHRQNSPSLPRPLGAAPNHFMARPKTSIGDDGSRQAGVARPAKFPRQHHSH